MSPRSDPPPPPDRDPVAGAARQVVALLAVVALLGACSSGSPPGAAGGEDGGVAADGGPGPAVTGPAPATGSGDPTSASPLPAPWVESAAVTSTGELVVTWHRAATDVEHVAEIWYRGEGGAWTPATPPEFALVPAIDGLRNGSTALVPGELAAGASFDVAVRARPAGTTACPPEGSCSDPDVSVVTLRNEPGSRVAWDPTRVRAGAGALDECPSSLYPGARHVDAERGHDAGPGTADAPWRTLAHAVVTAEAGATVVVHAGTYRESIGVLDRPLRLVGAPGPVPRISGADVVTGWQPVDDGTWAVAYDSPFSDPVPGAILPDQLTAEAPAAGLLDQVLVDGEPLEQVADPAEVGPGRFAVDPAAGRLVPGTDPAGRTVEVARRDRALLVGPGADGTELRCLAFSAFSPRHVDGEAAVVVDADDVTLVDVGITLSAATGLGVYGRRAELVRVTADANGARGATAHQAGGLVVAASRFVANNTSGFDHVDCGGGSNCVLAGMKITDTDGVEVRGSLFADNTATGLWCDLACRNAVIVGNVFAANAGHGLYYEVSRDAVVAANLFEGHGVGSDGRPGDGRGVDAGLSLAGSSFVTVHRNTFEGNRVQLYVPDDPRSPDAVLSGAGVSTDPEAIDVAGNVFATGDLVDVTTVEYFVDTAASPIDSRLSAFTANAEVVGPAAPRVDDDPTGVPLPPQAARVLGAGAEPWPGTGW